MSLVINNNLMAYGATNSLNAHYARMGTSVQRLSSGLRINGASDDAAGLAVRELMRSDIATMQQGIRNANDAISMIQTADGALGVIDEKLIRMKELAEQAATGTYDTVQRNIINDEYQLMASEITRIANATDFNQIKLLDGTLSGVHQGNTTSASGSIKIHFGTGNDSAEDYYFINIEDSTASAFGVGSAARAHENENIVLGATEAADPTDVAADGEFNDEDWGNFAGVPGMREFATTFNAGLGAAAVPPVPITITAAALANAFTAGAEAVFANAIKEGKDRDVTVADMNKWAQDMARIFDVEGDTALQDAVAGIQFVYDPTPVVVDGVIHPGTWTVAEADFVDIVPENIDDPEAVAGTVGDRAVLINAKMNELNSTMHPGNNVSTQANAQNALAALDEAIVRKDSNRANLGAYQNRLENTVANLTIQRQNLQASESRVSDIDVASEMTNFVRNQTLAQAAVGMLAQANSLPQMAMQLIG